MPTIVTYLLLTAAASAAQQDGIATAPRMLTDLNQWLGADAYPPDAIRAAAEGRTLARLSVSATGHVTDCVVVSSSGNASLDAVTCRRAYDRLQFQPATDLRGRPVASSYTLPVRWVLPRGAASLGSIDVGAPNFTSPAATTEVRIGVAPDGTVRSCSALPAIGLNGPINVCTPYPVGRKIMPAVTRNGRPIGATIVHRLSVETRFDP